MYFLLKKRKALRLCLDAFYPRRTLLSRLAVEVSAGFKVLKGLCNKVWILANVFALSRSAI